MNLSFTTEKYTWEDKKKADQEMDKHHLYWTGEMKLPSITEHYIREEQKLCDDYNTMGMHNLK